MQIQKLSYNLGAEILGVDLRQSLDATTFSQIHAAFLQYSMLLFRDQPITKAQQIEFSRRFGELDNNDMAPRDRDPEFPEILLNTNRPLPGGKPLGKGAMVWHSDRAFMCSPAMATVMHGVDLPDVGGDTLFANMYLAYDTLSEGMKKLIEGLYGVHPGPHLIIDASTPERLAATSKLSRPIAHPLVRVHPETGRKVLYVGEKVNIIDGMTVAESVPLIRFLCAHATRPQGVYRHRWNKDDVLMWDNRCTLHMAVNDYDKTKTRYLDKTCVMGTPSGGYVYDGPMD